MEAFQEVSAAFEVLSDPVRRREIDRNGASSHQPRRSESGSRRAASARREEEDSNDDDDVDALACAYYLLLIAIYGMGAFSGLILLAGKVSLAERLSLCAKMSTVASVAPLLAWARDARHDILTTDHGLRDRIQFALPSVFNARSEPVVVTHVGAPRAITVAAIARNKVAVIALFAGVLYAVAARSSCDDANNEQQQHYPQWRGRHGVVCSARWTRIP